MIRPEDAATQQQIPSSERPTVMIRPEDAAKNIQGQDAPGPAGMGTQPQAGNSSIPGRGVPTGEMTTARVTLGDTGNLTKDEKKGAPDVNKNRDKNEQKKYAVKKRPKHLGLKIAILCVLLLGVGLGSFFVIRAMQGEQKRTAFYKSFTSADVERDTDNSLYVRNQLIIRAVKEATEKKISKLIKDKNAVIVGEIPISNEYQVEFDPGIGRSEMDDIIAEWEKSDLVASVSLHHAYGTAGGTFFEDNPWRDDNNPDDPSGSEWNIYQPDGNNWAVESVWAPKIWEGLEDESGKKEYAQVDVGLIDTTVDTTHKDLSDRFNALKQGGADPEESGESNTSNAPLIEGNPSAVADDYSQYTGRYAAGDMDEAEQAEEKRLSHGTHTAGIISAKLEDDFGIAGVAQNAKLYGYAAGSDASYQNGDYKEARSLTSTFAYKYTLSRMQENSIRLVNISMLLDPMVEDEAVRTRIMEDMNADMEYFLKACLEQNWDFLLIKSAGDDSTDQFNDAFLCGITDTAIRERIVVVGGAECDYQGGKLEGYKKTETTNYGERIDIYAPGPDVLSDIPGDRTEKRSGTSEATAFVTGGCALVMGILPTLSMPEVKDIVLKNYYYTVEDTGKGYLNLYMAVAAARARRDSSDASGIKDEMQKEIDENNLPKTGTLLITLEKGFLEQLGDPSVLSGSAEKDGETVPFSFDKDGNAKLELTEGTWTISIEADGYEAQEFKETVAAGETAEHTDLTLDAMLRAVELNDLPNRAGLEVFLKCVPYSYSEVIAYDCAKPGNQFIGRTLDCVDGVVYNAERYMSSLPAGYDKTIRTDELRGFEEADPLNKDPFGHDGQFWWCGYKKDGVLWIEKNVMNLSEEQIAKCTSEADSETLYDHEGYYYAGTFMTDPGMLTIKPLDARRKGNIYYLKAEYRSGSFTDSEQMDADGYPVYYDVFSGEVRDSRYLIYRLEYKNVDGIFFWSIYECHEMKEGEWEQLEADAKTDPSGENTEAGAGAAEPFSGVMNFEGIPSGAGGSWQEILVINADGTFSDSYTAENFDSYETGRFVDVQKVSEYCYTMKVADVTGEGNLDDGDVVTLYLKGTPISEISEDAYYTNFGYHYRTVWKEPSECKESIIIVDTCSYHQVD